MDLNELVQAVAGGISDAARKPNFWNYQPNPGAQTDFHKSESVGRLLVGSNRSGKTVAGIVEDGWWLTGQHPFMETPEPPVHGRIITVDSKYGAAGIIEPALAQWIPPSYRINGSWEDSYRKSEQKLKLRNGSTLEIMTHNQELEAFAGTARHFLHVDEECPKDIFTESRMRLLDYHGRFWITMTPVEGMTWIYDDLVQNANNNVEVFKINVMNNPHISEEARKILFKDLSEEDKEVRLEGDFRPKGGKIFKEFDLEKHVISPGRPPMKWSVFVSIDSGFNNPTAIYWHAVSPVGLIITFAEHYMRQWTVKQHAERIQYKNNQLKASPIMYIGDPSMSQRSIVTGFSILDEYRGCGIPVIQGKKDPIGGINKMNEYLRQTMWYITEDCPNLIREMVNYSWKTYDSPKTTDKNNRREEPQKKNDHGPDSCRYFFSYVPMLTPEMTVKKQFPKMSATEYNQTDFPWHVDLNLFPRSQEGDMGWGEV